MYDTLKNLIFSQPLHQWTAILIPPTRLALIHSGTYFFQKVLINDKLKLLVIMDSEEIKLSLTHRFNVSFLWSNKLPQLHRKLYSNMCSKSDSTENEVPEIQMWLYTGCHSGAPTALPIQGIRGNSSSEAHVTSHFSIPGLRDSHDAMLMESCMHKSLCAG